MNKLLELPPALLIDQPYTAGALHGFADRRAHAATNSGVLILVRNRQEQYLAVNTTEDGKVGLPSETLNSDEINTENPTGSDFLGAALRGLNEKFGSSRFTQDYGSQFTLIEHPPLGYLGRNLAGDNVEYNFRIVAAFLDDNPSPEDFFVPNQECQSAFWVDSIYYDIVDNPNVREEYLSLYSLINILSATWEISLDTEPKA